MLAGAAAGYQEILHHPAGLALERGKGIFLAEEADDVVGLGRGGHPHPARIGIFLILVPHLERDIILDRGEARNLRGEAAFFQGFAQLLGQHRFDRRGPGPRRQLRRLGKGEKREIGCHGQKRERRDLAAGLQRRDHGVAQFFSRGDFVRGGHENILIDEALLCQGGGETKCRIIGVRVQHRRAPPK